MSEISKWFKIFKKVPPIGYELREHFPSYWFRIHNLPNGKLSSENDDEIDELQTRHKQVAKKVLGVDLITLFVGVSRNSSDVTIIEHEWAKGLNFKQVISYDTTEEDDDNTYFLNFYETQFSVKSNHFKSIVMDVTNENICFVLFFAQETGNVYAPYDAGADLFVPNKKEFNELVIQFAHWIPKKDSGFTTHELL